MASLRRGPLGRLRFQVVAGRSPLVPSDLTFLGQVEATGTTYANPCLAIRFVGGERRYLTYEYSSNGAIENVGDLVEYKVTATLKNGDSHWTLANVPAWTEVRRWSNWSTWPRMVAGNYGSIFKGDSGNGAAPSSFYWDEAHGLLWYTWQPWYPGGEIIWPVYNAVRLLDGEAGGNVSDANIYGPYYFRANNVYDDFKDASCGLIPIPADRQTAMGGKFIAVGHHCANIGDQGGRSLGMWVINDVPATPPAQDSVLWPTAVHLYDTSPSSGINTPNMHEPNFIYANAWHTSNSGESWLSHEGVAVQSAENDPVGIAVGDCIYFKEYQYIDTLCVFMHTGATGGSWVPEVYNGSTWVQPSGWATAEGTVALGAAENVFYWPKVSYSSSAPDGLPSDYYVRLRRTVAGSSGGALWAANSTVSVDDVYNPLGDKPENVGGYNPAGQYDATHYAFMLADSLWGGAWVQTDNVEGLAYFGAIATGGYSYGGYPMWAQPTNGGTPVRHENASINGPDWSNGPKNTGPRLAEFLPFNTSHLLEAAAGTRGRNNTGINPVSYTELHDTFVGLIASTTCPNVASPYYGEPNHVVYGWGHSVVYDATARYLIVLLTNGAVYGRNILAFFQVR